MLEIPTESRFEIKYVCDKIYYKSLVNWIKLNKLNFTKAHPYRNINNAYFDNHLFDNYKSNVYGISSRAKFRLRWYDDLESCNNSVFEIKYKRNTYGWKKKILLKKPITFFKSKWKDLIKTLNENLPEDLKLFFQSYSCPVIINSYLRDYFISYDQKIRITLDQKHFVYDQRHSPIINLNYKYPSPEFIVMEVKFDRKDVDIVNTFIKTVPMIQSKNSKYCNSIRVVSGV